MKIEINGEILPFQLEHEKNLGDVIAGLETWLATASWKTKNLQVNGQETWNPQTPLDQIQTIAVEALPIPAADLGTILEYFLVLERNIAVNDPAGLKAALETLPQVLEALPQVFGPLYPRLTSAVQVLTTWAQDPWLDMEAGKTALRVLGTQGQDYMDELLAPQTAWVLTQQTLAKLLPLFNQIPVQFQVGEDAKALTAVMTLLNLVEDLLRQASHPAHPQAAIYQSLVQEVQSFLKDLQSAFENRDMVTISDLLEYEILPRLQGFLPPETP